MDRNRLGFKERHNLANWLKAHWEMIVEKRLVREVVAARASEDLGVNCTENNLSSVVKEMEMEWPKAATRKRTTGQTKDRYKFVARQLYITQKYLLALLCYLKDYLEEETLHQDILTKVKLFVPVADEKGRLLNSEALKAIANGRDWHASDFTQEVEEDEEDDSN